MAPTQQGFAIENICKISTSKRWQLPKTKCYVHNSASLYSRSITRTYDRKRFMHRISAPLYHALASAALVATLLPAAHAADHNADTADQPAAQSMSQPAPNPAAEKALGQRFQSVFDAFEGKAELPGSENFTDAFNQQATHEQVQQVLRQVHDSVGHCSVAAQTHAPTSYATSYLLQCDKAFQPLDIAVEEKAPYRIHSLLIRPGYWKP